MSATDILLMILVALLFFVLFILHELFEIWRTKIQMKDLQRIEEMRAHREQQIQDEDDEREFIKNKEIFIQNLKTLFNERKLTQKKLAKDLNVDQSVINDLLYGVTTPKITTLISIADYFGVSIDWLVGRTENPDVNV